MEYIRKLTKDDKEQVLSICDSIWDGEDYIPAIFDEWITASNSYFVGLFEDNKLLGFGRLASHGNGNFWLEGLRKNHSLKIKGVGKKIADYLIKIAIEKECKSLKFSTYFNNVESISLNEKIGFSKIKQWSYLEIQKEDFEISLPNFRDEDFQHVEFEDFSNFIISSRFLAEMSNYLCEGWKVFDATMEYLKSLYENSTTFAIIRDNNIESMISTVIDNEKNIFITFFDYKSKLQSQKLLKKVFVHAIQLDTKAVSIIVPNNTRVDFMHTQGFESWEQSDDFLLFEYRGKDDFK